MHAYLIISKNSESSLRYAEKIAVEHKMKLLQIELQKIADTKSLTSFTNLSLSKTAIFIENIDTATPEAVNAFLKTLEEPSGELIFILTAKNEHSVLPTVLSRCQIIRTDLSIESDAQKAHEFLAIHDFERLNELKEIKNRDAALEYLNQLVYSLNRLLTTEDANHRKVAQAIKLAEKTKLAISGNGNVTLQLANFAINL